MMPAVLGALLTIGSFGYSLSVRCLCFAAAAALSGRHSILVLLGGCGFARIWVDGSGTLAIAANSLAALVLGAILR